MVESEKSLEISVTDVTAESSSHNLIFSYFIPALVFLALFRQANNNLSRRKFFTRISYGEEERLDEAVEELSRRNTPMEDQGNVD